VILAVHIVDVGTSVEFATVVDSLAEPGTVDVEGTSDARIAEDVDGLYVGAAMELTCGVEPLQIVDPPGPDDEIVLRLLGLELMRVPAIATAAKWQ